MEKVKLQRLKGERGLEKGDGVDKGTGNGEEVYAELSKLEGESGLLSGYGLAVAENRTIRCDYGKFILENLVEANLKGSTKNKLYMSARPMLTRIAYQALGMIEDLPTIGSQASLIQHAKFVAKPIKTKTTATSSRATRSSKKNSSDDEKTDTDKEQDSQGSGKEASPKGAEAKGPSEFEKNDEEDTSTPLDKKSKKPRSEQQVLLTEAQARVEERKKMLAEARAAKAVAKSLKPQTMEEARLARIEKAKALQEERRRIKSEQKAQEVDLTSHTEIIRYCMLVPQYVTPMETGLKLSFHDAGDPADVTLYQTAVGCLIYVCNTRPDIQCAVSQDTANTIYTDSHSALAVARNPVFYACTKHIEVHYHYVRERLSAGEISLAYVPTHDNLADLFTKALSREKLEAFHKALGLLPFVD
ncbi:hypothetical protein L7F22_039968 [Adiantum nelumboides]|nr:hypothetical protein [Adiantum nelumboides]